MMKGTFFHLHSTHMIKQQIKPNELTVTISFEESYVQNEEQKDSNYGRSTDLRSALLVKNLVCYDRYFRFQIIQPTPDLGLSIS